MTQNKDHVLTEEVVLPEHLLPLGSVLGEGVSAIDLCMVLAKIFHVQYTEVALMRLEGGLLRFVFPEYLRTTGAIPLSSKAVAAHTALSKKAEIFNNFARVKHASIFETIKQNNGSDEPAAPSPIQKLMSVPIIDQERLAFPVGYEYRTDDGQTRTSTGTVKVVTVEPGGDADLFSLKVDRTGRFVFSSGVIGKAEA